MTISAQDVIDYARPDRSANVCRPRSENPAIANCAAWQRVLVPRGRRAGLGDPARVLVTQGAELSQA
ncbi:hypothetical protein ACPCTO_30285 [Streptomyces olivoreticuli]